MAPGQDRGRRAGGALWWTLGAEKKAVVRMGWMGRGGSGAVGRLTLAGDKGSSRVAGEAERQRGGGEAAAAKHQRHQQTHDADADADA